MTVPSPWMTPPDPLKSQKDSFENTVFQYRFFHVLTTGRSIATTSRKQRRDHILINQDWKYG
jgi:hypothetical protein